VTIGPYLLLPEPHIHCQIIGCITRFEVFTAIKILVVFFWVVTPYRIVIGYQHFGVPCCFHHLISPWKLRHHGSFHFTVKTEAAWSISLHPEDWGSMVYFLTSPWKWRQHSCPKRCCPTTSLHCVTTQKTKTWIYRICCSQQPVTTHKWMYVISKRYKTAIILRRLTQR